MRAQIHDLSVSPWNKEQTISFRTNEDCRDMFEKLKGKDLTVTVKRYHKPRSLDANAYAWVLMDNLAAVLGITKENIYKNYIRGMGGNNAIVKIRNDALDKFCTSWEQHGLGWVTDIMPNSTQGFSNVICYYGSSTYDAEQMSRLINFIVQDCVSVGIETRSAEDIASLMEEWNGR